MAGTEKRFGVCQFLQASVLLTERSENDEKKLYRIFTLTGSSLCLENIQSSSFETLKWKSTTSQVTKNSIFKSEQSDFDTNKTIICQTEALLQSI